MEGEECSLSPAFSHTAGMEQMGITYILLVQEDAWLPLYLSIGVLFKGLVAQAPNLIHDHPKTPYVTSSGVFLVMNCLQQDNHYYRCTYVQL